MPIQHKMISPAAYYPRKIDGSTGAEDLRARGMDSSRVDALPLSRGPVAA